MVFKHWRALYIWSPYPSQRTKSHKQVEQSVRYTICPFLFQNIDLRFGTGGKTWPQPHVATLKILHIMWYTNHVMLHVYHFFSYIFLVFFCICTSAAPQKPAHGTVSSQVATHLRTNRICRVLGRSWIQTQDY
jgi:hypothetical protein